MGLFSKDICSVCGKKTYKTAYIGFDGTIKIICQSCLKDMHINGIRDYSFDVLHQEVDFTQLMEYQFYYNSALAKSKHFPHNSNFVLQDVAIQNNLVYFTKYDDVVVQTSEVTQLLIEEQKNGTLKVTFVTSNRFVPHFCTIVQKSIIPASILHPPKTMLLKLLKPYFSNITC